MTLRRIGILTVVLALTATAAAQCTRGPSTSQVTLPEFLAVYYEQFRSIAAADAAEFYGGVCVTAVGGEWTVLADEVRLDELSGDIRLTAPEPALYLGEWQIRAALLRADENGLRLEEVELDGPDGSGEAHHLEVDLATGHMTLRGLTLAGAAFAVRGDLAVLEGTALRVEGAGLTTCIGLEEAPYEVEGAVALVDLQSREVRVQSGSLRVGKVTVPLRDEVVVSEAAFADFELPVRVAFVPGAPGRAGAGLTVRIVGIPAARGVDLALGATGLDSDHTTRGVALLEVEAEVPEAEGVSEVSLVTGIEAGAPYLDFSVAREVVAGVEFEFGVTSGAAPARAAVHEGVLALSAGTSVPMPEGSGVSAAASAEVFAAATAVTAAAGLVEPQVAGARLGGAATASASWQATPVSTFSLTTGAEATYYPVTWGGSVGPGTSAPGSSALQWGVRIRPSWRYQNGPITLSLSYDSLFTNAASPFGTSVDRLVPLQRAQGSFRLSGQIAASEAGTWTGSFGANAVYDAFVTSTPAGLKGLALDASVTYSTDPWTYRAEGRSELSGLIAPVGKDPFVELELTASRGGWPVLNPLDVPHGTLQLGLLANYALTPGAAGLEALELSGAVPLAFETFELRPYLAFDFAPTINAGLAPRWSGYGLDVTFITCCGSLTLGLLNDRGAWSAGVGIDLERRPPSKSEEADPGIMPADP